MNKTFYMLNAYTDKKLEGASVVILPDADGLNHPLQQKIAREFNADQTVFITSSSSGCPKLKIFNPQQEIPFGGHPTIASIHLLDHLNRITPEPETDTDGHHLYKSKLEENVGPIDILVQKKQGQPNLNQYQRSADYSFDTLVPSKKELGEMLGLASSALESSTYSPAVVHCDRHYLVVPCRSSEDLKNASFHQQSWSTSCAIQAMAKDILLFTDQPQGLENDFLCRLMGPDVGPHEDPPVGSSMPAFCAYLHETNQCDEVTFSVERGRHGDRFSLLNLHSCRSQHQSITVQSGGLATIVGKGELFLDD